MTHEDFNSIAKDGLNPQAPNDHMQDVRSKAIQTGRDLASYAEHKGKELENRAIEKTDSVLSSVGEGMTSLAATIHENAPNTGTVGAAANSVSETLKSGGQYLSAHNVDDIAKDVTDVVRKYPVASLWVGMGVGLLLGNALTRK